MSQRWAGVVGLLLLSIGCATPQDQVVSADAEVNEMLGQSTTDVLGGREGWIRQPEQVAIEDDADDDPDAEDPPGAAGAQLDGSSPPGDDAEPLEVGLSGSLLSGFSTSREFITRREVLYLQGLGLTLDRFAFGPQLSAAVSTVFGQGSESLDTVTSAGSVGLSQILPTGGVFSMSSSLVHTNTESPNPRVYDTAVNFSLFQPLGRGAGYEVSHERLTQAERDLVYDIRSFELFRQDHAISIAGDYFDLVSQRTRLANEERRYEDAVFDREKSEALRQLDRNKDEDVFLAQRNEIDAENGLLVARAAYERAKDDFRIRLGLPAGQQITIADEQPLYRLVSIDPDSAVDVALHNRLDLITERERLEDQERAVRIARDGLGTDVGLTLNYGRNGSHKSTDGIAGSGSGGALFDEWSSSAGLSIDVPIQRTPERNRYRSALIALDQARRDYELLEEEVDSDVRDDLRNLRLAEQLIEVQLVQIEQNQRSVAVTEIRYESGDVDNRGLLEARSALINAENALITLRVNHFIARLRLHRSLGLLFIDDDGMWRV